MAQTPDKYISADIQLADMINMQLTEVPAIVESAMRIQVPASQAQLDVLNSPRVGVFGISNGSPVPGFFAGDVVVNTIQCAMLIRGFGVRLSTGVRLFSLKGFAVAVPSGGATCVPALSGPPGPTDAFVEATLNYNMDAAEAAYHFAEGWKLVVRLACNFILVEESIADFGTIGCSSCFTGFGSAFSPTQDVIAEANDRMIAAGCPWQFVPLNSSSGGCCTPGTATPIGTQLAPVQWGGPSMEGVYGGVFPAPICLLIVPGVVFQMYLERNDNALYHQQKFIQLVSCEGEQTIGSKWSNLLCTAVTTVTLPFGGTIGATTIAAGGTLPAGSFSVNAAGVIVAGSAAITVFTNVAQTTSVVVAAGTTFLAAGVPAGAFATSTISTAIGKSSVVNLKAGNIDIIVELLGFFLEPLECLAYFSTYAPMFTPMIQGMYLGTASAWIGNQLVANGPKMGISPGVGVAGLLKGEGKEQAALGRDGALFPLTAGGRESSRGTPVPRRGDSHDR